MKKYKFKLHKLLIKSCIIILTIYIFLFISIAILANIVLFNLNSFRHNIENYIAKNTDYQLNIENIQTKFVYDYLPEIVLQEISINNKEYPTKKLRFKQINVQLSYSSLWKFNLIFDKIAINKTALAIEYYANDDIFLNGILISDHRKKAKSKERPFDFENWILQQKGITLNNINVSFWDKKNDFKKITLKNIDVLYTNQLFDPKHLRITINSKKSNNNFFADLKWHGNKFEDYSNWKSASFKLNSYSNNGAFFKKLQQYLPDSGFIERYKTKTAINATLKNGKLYLLQADFNLNNLYYTLSKSTDIINFPYIGGKLNIDFNEKNNTYAIKAESLQISTNKGVILDNKKINGYYVLDKNGEISIYDTNLNSINNLLSIIPSLKNVAVTGKINSLIISWDGNIFKPTNYLFNINFIKIGLLTKGDETPRINNISGNALISKESGSLNLSLESSTLIYKKLFYIPYQIKSLSSSINWLKKSESGILVNLKSTKIHASDFNIVAHGKYIYIPNNAGYLELYANLDKIPASRVGFYLPKPIDAANKWLKTAIIGGYGESATLNFSGWLSEFPFIAGSGKFYIDANVNNGRLLYVKGWPTIDNIYGKFMIRNQKIIITAQKARVNGNNLNNIEAIIPDMTHDQSYLIAHGNGYGSTQNFLNYLRHTPINKMIGNLPDKTIANGKGKVNLALKVPFSKPENTTVKGTYTFLNNNIKFDLPIPQIEKANGNLDFTNKGINISSITAKILDGTMNLTATTGNNGVMNFTAKTENINYTKLSEFYLPLISPLISGNASTNINFSINGQGVNHLVALSNLKNVEIDAPIPLHKNLSESKDFKFYMNSLSPNNAYNINFTYNDSIFSKFTINSRGDLDKANVHIGNDVELNEYLPATVKISATPDTIDLIEWLNTIKKISRHKTLHDSNITNKDGTYITTNTETRKTPSSTNTHRGTTGGKTHDTSIDVSLQTNQLHVGDLIFGKAHAEAYITNNIIAFNTTSKYLDGYGIYYVPENRLNVLLYFLNINKKETTKIDHNQTSTKSSSNIIESKNIDIIENDNYFNQIFESRLVHAKNYANSVSNILNFPKSTIYVKQLYFKGNNLGNLNISLNPQGPNLIVESSRWNGNDSILDFNALNYCFECNKESALTVADFYISTRDLGKTLSNLRYHGILSQTSGDIQGSIQWPGLLNDINLNSVIAKIDINLKNGRFLKVNAGTLIGNIIGIISLQTIVNIVNLKFGNIFANGYAFDTLKAHGYILNNTIYIKYLYMSSTMAVVGLKGMIDLNNNTVNLYLKVTPSIGLGVAVGAGIVTLNPLIGVATYLAEIALKNPVNKLFAFAFHLTGPIEKPNVKQIGVSKQLTKNISSTIGK
ncbi:MAG: YhdP family protein [Neisseriaceae bacterium]